jgi:hypothetical protein
MGAVPGPLALPNTHEFAMIQTITRKLAAALLRAIASCLRRLTPEEVPSPACKPEPSPSMLDVAEQHARQCKCSAHLRTA